MYIKKGGMDMELNEILSEIYNIAKKSKDCVELIQKTLFYNTMKTLTLSDEIMEEMTQKNLFIEKKLKDEVKKNPAAEVFIPVPRHFGKIQEHIQSLSSDLKEKNAKDILFNDKMIAELNFLMEKVIDILNNTADMVLAKNTLILGYVKESEASIERAANAYATKHEEQLIEGIAPIMSSTLFVNILNSLKSISWHARKVTEEVFGYSPKGVKT
jgi:Na+/phosphate symporter